MRTSGMLSGLLLGAGAMYFLDPQQGRRRRKLLTDQLNRIGHDVPHALDAAWRDLSNRAQGTVAELWHLVGPDDVSDDVLVQRVRSRVGRVLSHPAALEVDAADGVVKLGGPVLAHEVEPLVSAVRGVRGVRGVSEELDVHDFPGAFSPLQGGGREPNRLAQEAWAPGTRLAAGAVGLSMLACGAGGRLQFAPLWSLGGLALMARAATNQTFARMLGLGGGRRSIDLQKTIHIDAPLERVYAFFADPTNLRRVSNMVTEVHMHGSGRFTKIMTFGGTQVRFEERFTQTIRNELLRSRSQPGSVLQYVKEARFQRDGDGTRLQMRFSYNPPGGIVAHAVAGVLGFDPKTVLDDLLMRAKQYLETGIMPHDAAAKGESIEAGIGQRHVPAATDVWTSGKQ
jgi:uncharacterized membrane protein